MSYSLDFRKKVLEVRCKYNLSDNEVGSRFGISGRTVWNWRNKGIAKKIRVYKPRKLDLDALRLDLEKYPDAYNYERGKRLGVSANCVMYGLRRLGISRKKKYKTS